MNTRCRLCGGVATPLFTARVLGDTDVAYFQCTQCRLVQTETPFWLERAYYQPIGTADTSQIERSFYAAAVVQALLSSLKIQHPRVVDYGAGYGLLVRLLRNAGIDAYWSDRYAPNLFAPDASWEGSNADLVTCFEVVEHFVAPLDEFERMLTIGRTLLFSTVLIPDPAPAPTAWEYYALDGGQHIALYTIETLTYLAHDLGLNLYSNQHNLHLLTERTLPIKSLSTADTWQHIVHRIERTFSPIPFQPSLMAVDVSSPAQQRPLFGIAIFHGLGDIVNATIIARQIKHDHPTAHIVWFTAEQYAFALDNNPDIDEIVALQGDPYQLDKQIEKLRSSRPWTEFVIPAPYMAYDKRPGGDLTELMLTTYNGSISVPLRPVMVLRPGEVEQARTWWTTLPADRPRILVETEFYSRQSPWDESFALQMIDKLAPLRPVFVFTAKNRPPYFERLAGKYPDIIWCNLPFRLNAELYNLCDAFIGVSSAISCLTNSTWCRDDVPHIEVVSGPHWSTWHFTHHKQRRICFDRLKFEQALEWLYDTLRGQPTGIEPQASTSLLSLYTHRVEGKYHYLSPALLPDGNTPISEHDAIRAITRTLEEIEPFYLCYGGIGDFLLALSSALESDAPITVVAYPNSVATARAFFDCFPQITRVYIISRHCDSQQQYVAGMYLRYSIAQHVQHCLGRGVTPALREDDFWKPGLDIERQCGVRRYPQWILHYRGDKIAQPQIVLAPMGSLSGMFRSKRNIIPPQYWQPLLGLFEQHNIRPIILGTPEEAEAYPSTEHCDDRRSYSFDEQFRILASADLVIAADSWHKTFAAMAQVPTIVFAPMVNHDLAFWQDSSQRVFIEPWENIRLVHNWDQACHAIAEHLSTCGIEFDRRTIGRYRPPERPQRTNPHQPLTSLHPIFWERNYDHARSVLIRLPDAVGDTLMVTAIVRALRAAHPHLEITIAATPSAADVFQGNPDVARCIAVNSYADLRAEADADIVVDYRFLLDQLPEYYGILPMMDILANIAGIRLPDRRIRYFPTDNERQHATSLLPASTGPVIAIHLVSTKDERRTYPKQKEVLDALCRAVPDASFIWLGTQTAPIASAQVVDSMRENLTLREQIALVERCDLALTVDSVFFHVAHNLWQKPTVLLAGPTSEYLIGDYTAAPLYALRGTGCTACYWHPQRCKRVCMASLSPETIATTVAHVLKRLRSGVLTKLPLPPRTPLRCKWDPLQHDLFAACMRFREWGQGLVALQISADHQSLPPYAAQWNGVEILSAERSQQVSLSNVFHL